MCKDYVSFIDNLNLNFSQPGAIRLDAPSSDLEKVIRSNATIDEYVVITVKKPDQPSSDEEKAQVQEVSLFGLAYQLVILTKFKKFVCVTE